MEDIYFAQFAHDIPSLDLHGISDVRAAEQILESELYACHARRQPYVRVVHGIGKGTMATMVHAVLDKNPLVDRWQEEASGGSCVILIATRVYDGL